MASIKPLSKEILSSPTVVGYTLMNNADAFEILNNPNQVIGPLRAFAQILRNSEANQRHKTWGRKLLSDIDSLERKMNSAAKDLRGMSWVRLLRTSNLSDFNRRVRNHTKYKDLEAFYKKLKEINKLLIKIKRKIREFA